MNTCDMNIIRWNKNDENKELLLRVVYVYL